MIGIKGSGMAALATLLHSLGMDVSGCDREEYIFTQELLDEKGIKYFWLNITRLEQKRMALKRNVSDIKWRICIYTG